MGEDEVMSDWGVGRRLDQTEEEGSNGRYGEQSSLRTEEVAGGFASAIVAILRRCGVGDGGEEEEEEGRGGYKASALQRKGSLLPFVGMYRGKKRRMVRMKVSSKGKM